MEFLGFRADRYIWASFAVSGLITGLAGSMNALLFNFASPQDLHYVLSGNFAIMVVLGGLIGGLIVAMYLPIFKLGAVVG